MNDIWNKNIELLLNQKKSSGKCLIYSLKLLSFCKGGWKNWILPIILGIFLSFLLPNFYDDGIKDIIDKIIDIELAVFGIIFTIYSIIIVFFSDELTKTLIRIEENSSTDLFRQYTSYYADMLYLIFINICISLIFWMVINMEIQAIKNYVCWQNIIIGLYFVITLRILFEVKSTIYNTVSLFNLSMSVKLKSLRENNK